MTDIMKLTDDYAVAQGDVRADLGANAGMDEQDPIWVAMKEARSALQSAIEALQSKLGDAIQSSAHWQHQFTEAQAENEQFRLLAKANSEALGAALVERDALQAKLNAMGKGEPVAWRFVDDKDNGHVSYSTTPPTDAQVAYLKIWKRPAWQPLYEAPKALEPLTDEQIEQAVKTYGVSWTGYREDDHGFYTIPVLSPYHYQFARAVEAAHGIRAKGGQHEDA